MFGHEAAVKHTLLESERPKYFGTDDGMINKGLMTKLYHIVAHNLNEARKARDGNKRGKTVVVCPSGAAWAYYIKVPISISAA